jgi:hypothetical protein
MTLDQLPTFTAHLTEGDRADGVVDRALWIGEGHLADLLLPDTRFVPGRFIHVDLQSLRAAFVPSAAQDISRLQRGMTYRRFDRYWGERAALVLDRQRHWTQRTFQPVDAVAFKRAGVTLVQKATNQNLPEGATLIRNGWDHEHCDLCWETISGQTDPVAMFCEPEHWICRKCYERFVVPRSLDFICVEHSDQSAGKD